MPKRISPTGSELFIVDNSDQDWKVLRYLHDWCQISDRMDIATAYFEIGALLALKDEWQKVDHIRILMGDEVSRRTKKAFEQGLKNIANRLDDSIETEKEKNDFLKGVPAIAEGIRSGKILCRVYRKEKFHAKAYITHGRLEVVGSSALVGSSNLTFPGITENIELNVQITGAPVNVLQEWFEEHWNQAEDISPEILKTLDRHIREFSPFEIYAKSLYEYFKGYEQTADDWERNDSKIYKILAKYQQDGYHGLLKRAGKYRGAFLCDGVGLGKTFVGLMLIERLVIREKIPVALFVPKAAREAVWEFVLKQYLPEVFEGFYGFKIFNHTDLLRDKMKNKMKQVHNQAEAIIIDEAHHFRNTGIRGENEDDRQSRYWEMFDLAEGKQLYLLTATPVNNRLIDLQHIIELFSRKEFDYFKDAPLGIHSLAGHFRKMEKALERAAQSQGQTSDQSEIDILEAEKILSQDDLFQALVVQRSRAYVKESMKQEGDETILFPNPREPKVVPYSVKQTYGKLLKMIEDAFNKDKPLFSLPIYNPYAYFKGDPDKIDPMEKGRQIQVVSLIRTQFLKRFESSVEAFTLSCSYLLQKLLAWVEVNVETQGEKNRLERWKRQRADLIHYVREQQPDLFGGETEEDADEDIITPEMLKKVERLSRDNFRVEEIIAETLLDLDQIAEFLKETKNFKPAQDKKLRALVKLLKEDRILKEHKVIIFSEFMDTARYLKKHLEAEGIDGVAEVDSASKVDRASIIRRFSPYYNGSSSGELAARGETEIRVLVSTDVLSEGLNLQDATCMINYDIHWNPVRLMQRIGRVDRRMNPDIEARIMADHPEQKNIRGTINYWNFLPPDELNEILSLWSKVTNKTLRISKTFGIEGKKLLTPEDEYEDLRNFIDEYNGVISPVGKMQLALQNLLKENPQLESRLESLPKRIFSGKEHPKKNSRAVFFCYGRPALDEEAGKQEGEKVWTAEAGDVAWYLYDLATEKVIEDAADIFHYIRCLPETPRHAIMEQKTLCEIRAIVDKHIKNTYLKKVNAPLVVKPILKAWMELS
ncbi:helicase [Candidatus Sumerlaeota bacterium]|nr:helicase [Candidatus Sumerlaeota bacterium]